MKELIGFAGRLFFVYGIPLLGFIVSHQEGTKSGWVIIIAVAWMFIFHFITKNWEDWGSNNKEG